MRECCGNPNVCDYIPDPGPQRYLKEMPHEEFVKIVTGEGTMTHRHKLRDPLLWYSLYCQWAAAHNLLPIGALVPENDDSAFDECPLKAADWSKIISVQLKEWKVELSRSPSTTAPTETWRGHLDLPTSLLPSDKAPSEDAFQSILDDVQYYPDSLMRAATDSLRELLLSAKVDAKQVRSIETAKQAPQLHAGLKALSCRQSAAVRKVLLPQLTKWNDLCIKTAPPVVQAADRVAFMKQFRELVQSAPRNTEWYDVVAHMVFPDLQIPDRCDGFAEISDAKTLLRIACQVTLFGKSKSVMRAVLKKLTTALGATPPEASTELPQTDFDKYWQEPLFGDSSPSSSQPPASARSQKPQGKTGATEPEVFQATPQTGVKDGVVVRLTGLSSGTSATRYRQAVHDIFGVSCNLEDNHVSRRWYHITVPKTTAQRLFGAEVAMEFKSKSGFSLKARTHDLLGEPYASLKRPRPEPQWSNASREWDRPHSSWSARTTDQSVNWYTPSHTQASQSSFQSW